jgi:hypothetical protein
MLEEPEFFMHRPLALFVVMGCRDPKTDPVTPSASDPEIPEHPDLTPTTPPTPYTPPETDPGPVCELNRPLEALYVFQVRCGSCHGPNSPEQGGLTNVLDDAELVAAGWVTPGDVLASPLMDTIYGDTMPPVSGGGRLSDDEKYTVEQWVVCGADSWGEPASTRGFLAPEMALQAAMNDVAALPVEDRANARYLSLLPLYNAEIPADRLTLYASALPKLLWNLTTAAQPPLLQPVPLDGLVLADGSVVSVADELGSQLLFRVDLGGFGWYTEGDAVDVWEEVVKGYPFAASYVETIAVAEELAAATRTRVPIVHGDWFAANVSLPPLYGDVMDLPATVDDFVLQFGGVDLQGSFDTNQVDCAGMDGNQTLVSNFNQVICRQGTSAGGYCWEAFNFGSIIGEQNIFAYPTAFQDGIDVGQAMCSLPSGQLAYMLFDALGARIDEAPINVVSDYNPDSGGIVRTGLSCMRCHEQGVVERADQVLDAVLANAGSFDPAVVDQVIAWYATNPDLAALQAADVAAFGASLQALQVQVGEEPTWALAEDWEASVSGLRVAADFALPGAIFRERLAADPALQVVYADVMAGSPMARADVELAARDTICAMQTGDVCDPAAFCGESAAPCPDGATCDALGQCSRLE